MRTLGYTKQEVLGDNYDKFFKKKYTKKGFSFPIESYLKENNFIYEGNPLKSWSKLVLDKSFNIDFEVLEHTMQYGNFSILPPFSSKLAY